MSAFSRADILLPKLDHLEDWAVVACDQYTSHRNTGPVWTRARQESPQPAI